MQLLEIVNIPCHGARACGLVVGVREAECDGVVRRLIAGHVGLVNDFERGHGEGLRWSRVGRRRDGQGGEEG